jgi:hypothetical protein
MKLEKIRMATPEEISEVAKESNLTKLSQVLVMGEMKAVWKVVNELDPVFLNGASPQRFYKFIWGIENIMRGAGVDAYHFTVPVADENYLRIVEEFGGERTNKEPSHRYKVNL